jgi:hypothetical protein
MADVAGKVHATGEVRATAPHAPAVRGLRAPTHGLIVQFAVQHRRQNESMLRTKIRHTQQPLYGSIASAPIHVTVPPVALAPRHPATR